MSDDDTKAPLPGGADRLLPLGHCDEHGCEHVAAVKDGKVTSIHHMQVIEEGKPLPPNADSMYWVDTKDGRVVDSMRLGGGSGPAQVATKQYRDNYDEIFGKKTPDRSLN